MVGRWECLSRIGRAGAASRCSHRTEGERRRRIRARINGRGNLEAVSVSLCSAYKCLDVGRAAYDHYSDPTHFLLELLQNADDAEYDESVTPTLAVTLVKGRDGNPSRLRFDCNERGFSSSNMQSICRISLSSKPASHVDDGERIGEKGIGFKSVFAVASLVWINSGHYSFQFTDKGLGMIAPHWACLPAPEQALAGQTTILLELRSGDGAEERSKALVSRLKSLDPRLLLFLKRLKMIKIKIDDDGSSEDMCLQRQHQGPPPAGRHALLHRHEGKRILVVYGLSTTSSASRTRTQLRPATGRAKGFACHAGVSHWRLSHGPSPPTGRLCVFARL